jgi:hypothetical protein
MTTFNPERFAAILAKGVDVVVTPLVTRLAQLEKRVHDLEAAPRGVSYAGTWTDTATYAKDVAVTCAGSLWIARSANTSRRPGTADCWQLACKKGADGKDGKDFR